MFANSLLLKINILVQNLKAFKFTQAVNKHCIEGNVNKMVIRLNPLMYSNYKDKNHLNELNEDSTNYKKFK